MKSTKFLIKLKKEGKLEIIEPSENVAQSYADKSQSHLESSKILLASGKLEESVSMEYYGMYHILLAILFQVECKRIIKHLNEEKISKIRSELKSMLTIKREASNSQK